MCVLYAVTKKMHTLQRRFPNVGQLFPRLQESIPFGKYEKPTTRHQVRIQLPGQVSEHSFGPISPNGVPESPPDNDPHSGGGIVHLACKKIEEGRRKSPPMTFDCLDIPVTP